MPLLVMKFGGTSLATIELIKKAAERVKVEVSRGYEVIVIVSAMSGKTNELIGWVNKTSSIYDAREYDAIVSSGEQVTAGLLAFKDSLWTIESQHLAVAARTLQQLLLQQRLVQSDAIDTLTWMVFTLQTLESAKRREN